ncbi:hypothetical protein BLA24_25200 [Streptomyces cinnamoneus]|uniref:D-inositol 3-phosphate glycosyltransferase n=1 Tax=Streptomyces cinnamoneus TaxID=53446 RepID=A0A2G1XDP0_STRCJ|nr:DUF3492 domain-containing protein [Streptomyces cinnamoneus]PHQ49350.1 hypothetical protein BLA24_25200 [Streptomyces cinnamoneus]PPT15002.1 DUF3492 domain-containing protein [Streptomyces cinnamoneus]
MRVGLLSEGGYPYAAGEGGEWCDHLVRGLGQHDFELYALSRSARQEDSGWHALPGNVRRVRAAPLWGGPAPGSGGRAYGSYGRDQRRRFTAHFGDLAAAVTLPGDQAYRFADGLDGLADLARDEGGLAAALRSELALRALETACRAPGALPAAYAARVADLLVVSGLLERALRPLSLDWYGSADGDRGLAAVDLCHATSAGPAALPGLLAKRFFGTPLLVTEYEVRLREYYLGGGADPEACSAPARTLLSAFHRLLAERIYGEAALVTAGDGQGRRWQERCGADRARQRTVHPGMDASLYEAVGEGDPAVCPAADDGTTLVWVGGRVEPHLWEALAVLRAAEPGVRVRVVGVPPDPQTAPGTPEGVRFGPATGPEDYAAGSVVVLSGAVEGFPAALAEAMFCGRATVSPDVGAVREVIGGTGLVVPPRDPRALAGACLDLLRDPERRARLGAAARARALELFTVEQNVSAFGAIYLEVLSRAPVQHTAPDPSVPFSHAAGAHPPLTMSPRSASPTWAGRP